MNNIEKIRQEIERRREANKRQYLSSNGGMSWQRMCGEEDCLVELLAFIDSLPEEKPSEDLEEAADEYADKHGFRVPYDGSNNYYDDVDVKASKEGFLAGAEWALNQGVKATGIISPRGIIYDNNIGYRLFLERYHNGDKVEVQVRKIEENADSFTEDLEEAAKKRKMGITPIGIIRMKVQELKWADVDKAGDLDIHPLKKDKYDYSIKQCDKIIAFIDNLPLTIAKESPVLNEAADDYQTTFNKTIGPFFHDDQKRAFIDGALWQARQLIKSTPNRKP